MNTSLLQPTMTPAAATARLARIVAEIGVETTASLLANVIDLESRQADWRFSDADKARMARLVEALRAS